MQIWQALLLGALQGLSELFPVSSLAHVILVPALLGWNIDYSATHYLSFVVALHLATAAALVIYFWREWRAVVLSYLGSLRRRTLVYDRDSKFAWLLVAGTLLAGLFGLVFEKPIRQFFENPSFFWLSAILLVVNGGFMLYGEYLRRRSAVPALGLSPAVAASEAGSTGQASIYAQSQAALSAATADDRLRPTYSQARPPAISAQDPTPGIQHPGEAVYKRAEDLTFPQGAAIGATQILALVPGISRSGVTIIGGLFSGLGHEEAARFSFMLATPIIG